ncbi:MAG TPA: response regulator transcription factor, partial [Candidatus Ozemobacteraceae bacterium]|nr:response regulator transcription factor [Candidatus Ozemobacteraceae bacterium]
MIELRSNVRRMLSNFDNIRVVGEAGDGEEALAQIREVSPHIVLMDINMPKLDGLKATEMLAKERPNIQVVIMSIQSEQEYFRRAMKAGAKDFLTKPFSSNDLADTINKMRLAELSGRIWKAQGEIIGDFGKEYLPTAVDLHL